MADTMTLQVWPRVLRAGRAQKLRIVPGESVPAHAELRLTSVETYTNTVEGSEAELIGGFPLYHSLKQERVLPCKRAEGYLSAVFEPPNEGEWVLRLVLGSTQLAATCLYSVAEDWWGLYPYKGDFHIHSALSDGCEPPEALPARVRALGLDFMALSDHGRMAASRDLARTVAALRLKGFCAFPAEETHLPGHQMHILHVGFGPSINEVFLHRRGLFQWECGEMEKTLAVPPGVDRESYVSAIWALRRMRAQGDLSVFCHPFWRVFNGLSLGFPFTQAMLAAREFDAMELLSGYPDDNSPYGVEANYLQVALYNELERQGGAPPVVGTSDAHNTLPEGTERFLGSYYTLILAPGLGFGDVKAAILAGNSLAAMQFPGTPLQLFGGLRLVKYAYFLAREVLPRHDTIAALQAPLLAELGSGREELQAMDGELTAYYKAVFAW